MMHDGRFASGREIFMGLVTISSCQSSLFQTSRHNNSRKLGSIVNSTRTRVEFGVYPVITIYSCSFVPLWLLVRRLTTTVGPGRESEGACRIQTLER